MREMDVDELRRIVIKTYKLEQWDACLSACRELHARFPDNQSIVLKLGEIYAKGGKRDSAVDVYRSAAEKYAENGEFLQAVGLYKLMLRLSPEREDIRNRLDELCTKEKRNAVLAEIPKIPLLSDLKEDELIEVVKKLKLLTYPMGEVVCREGEEGHSIYAIIKGSVKVYVEGVAGEKIAIAQLKEGDFFGEVGFFADGKRHASVMAIDDTELLEIGKDDMAAVQERHPRIREVLEDFYKKRVFDKIMAVSPLFSTLKKEDREVVSKCFRLKSFKERDVVIREGDEGDSLFLVKSGKVEIFTSEGEKNVPLATLEEGDFFGEVSLITGKPRTATVKAMTQLELMELSRNDLMRCIEKHPKVEEILKRYLKVRMENTISKIMALKEIEAKEGIV